jgi:hypothetical protein
VHQKRHVLQALHKLRNPLQFIFQFEDKEARIIDTSGGLTFEVIQERFYLFTIIDYLTRVKYLQTKMSYQDLKALKAEVLELYGIDDVQSLLLDSEVAVIIGRNAAIGRSSSSSEGQEGKQGSETSTRPVVDSSKLEKRMIGADSDAT